MSSGRIVRFPFRRERKRNARAKRGHSPQQASRSGFRKLLDYLLIPTLIAVLALLAGHVEQAGLVRPSGTATVHDGDTITVEGERLRLRGIDAPELSQTCSKGGGEYPCGRLAREVLETLVAGRAVSCSGSRRDRYDRLLVTCAAGGEELNRAMVEQGWALAYGGYADAEAAASAAGRGLWAGSFERPQAWRVQHGGMVETEHDLLLGLGEWLARLFGRSWDGL